MRDAPVTIIMLACKIVFFEGRPKADNPKVKMEQMHSVTRAFL
jgi:hypothetical protein